MHDWKQNDNPLNLKCKKCGVKVHRLGMENGRFVKNYKIPSCKSK